tara:strand:+ start:685 stop:1236 length:552 start_codon:yes stop_codon:yes gene_type:complete
MYGVSFNPNMFWGHLITPLIKLDKTYSCLYEYRCYLILGNITTKGDIMATFTSDMVSGHQAFKPFPSGALGVRYAKINITAAPNAADVYQMVDVFAGETVHNVKIKSSDLDGATSLVWDVGDGSDADYYIDGSTAGQTGVGDEQDANVVPKTYSADDTIDITCQVAPGSDVATGTLEIWITVA